MMNSTTSRKGVGKPGEKDKPFTGYRTPEAGLGMTGMLSDLRSVPESIVDLTS